MTETLYEKFSWIKQDLIYAGPKGNKAQFKGVALLPTISGNGKKYVVEELHRSARTLVGKPLTLNHNPTKVLGDVTWAEFEGNCIEYVAETKNPEYIEKLKDCKRLAKEAYIKKWGRDPIYGVSVEANYRFHDAQCVGGNCTLEPHGIIFNALSLVEDPERPGVSGTTVELMETLNVEQRLSEMLVKDLVPKEIQSSTFTESKVTTMKSNKLKEEEMPPEDTAGCPEGQHKNEAGECIPDIEEAEEEPTKDDEEDDEKEDYSEDMMEIKHQIEKTNFKHAKETKLLREKLANTKTALSTRIAGIDASQKRCCNRLGETQKLLLETEAIAKGSLDKISGLEPKFEQFVETWQTKLTSEASTLVSMANEIKTDVATLKTVNVDVQEALAQKVSKEQLEVAVANIPKLEETLKGVQESLCKLPGIEEALKPLKEQLANLPKIEDTIKPLQETLTKLEGNLAESEQKYSTLNTVYEALNQKYEGFVKETQTKTLKETQESTTKLTEMQRLLEEKDKTLKEMQDQIDTLKLHVKPGFKAKLEEKKVEPSFSPPYTYGK